MEYTNFFERIGHDAGECTKRLNDIFDTLFFGPEEERIYHTAGDDMGYIVDTGNIDARTEGMSYGMMICVQLDHKEEFDRIWKWACTHMLLEEGRNRGFFCWSNSLDGSKNANGPAPDGEEYFAMALLFASRRWGDGEGIFDYKRQAQDLLHRMLRCGDGATLGRGMFDPENHLIRFITEVDFTDPSYHLPHFYELFSMWAYTEDQTFYAASAEASRRFLHKACHKTSGLTAEYSYYDGTPYEKGTEVWGKHDWYYSDAYRTIMNIAMDHIWFGKDSWQEEEGRRFINFMCDGVGVSHWGKVLDWDGTVRTEDVLHPIAVTASCAAAAMLTGPEGSDKDRRAYENALSVLRIFWDTPLRKGDRRYYDNCLYMFAFMMLSGNYRIW